MPIRTAAEKVAEPVAARPETFRLPKPGVSDPYFGFSCSFYYSGEERGYWKTGLAIVQPFTGCSPVRSQN
jgi:hypothetical protein